jgi:transglutaminase-like putative cysteine protease
MEREVSMKVCLWLLLISSAAPAQERWFEVQIAGHPAGRAHELVVPVAGGVETGADSETLIARLDAKLSLKVRVKTTEDSSGVLRAVHVETDMSAQISVTEATFSGRTATIHERAGAAAMHERTLPLQSDLLGPEALRKESAARLRVPGDSLLLPVWAAELGAPAQVRRTVLAKENGVLKVEEKYQDTPVSRTIWLDEQGELQRSESPAPFGVLALVRREAAPSLAAAELSKDSYERTLLRSNVRLPQPRELQRLAVRFALRDGALPELGSDTQQSKDGILEVRRALPPDAPPDAAAPPEFLTANVLIDSDDPEVRKIAAQVPGEGWERALALTRWTAKHMQFDLGVVFAAASELARDRRGTCVGYATLLASLLRAARIPSRVVFGYVYTGGIFAGHAWVEARFGNRWIPLDAALPSSGPADAARIAVAHDSMSDGPGRILSLLQQVYGNASLEVLEYGGARASSKPYRVADRQYLNPGLGLSAVAPAGMVFNQLESVWPDRTLFLLEGNGGKVSLEEDELDPSLPRSAALREALKMPCKVRSIAGRPGCAGRDALIFADGSTAYVLKASGARKASLLQAAARGISLR